MCMYVQDRPPRPKVRDESVRAVQPGFHRLHGIKYNKSTVQIIPPLPKLVPDPPNFGPPFLLLFFNHGIQNSHLIPSSISDVMLLDDGGPDRSPRPNLYGTGPSAVCLAGNGVVGGRGHTAGVRLFN